MTLTLDERLASVQGLGPDELVVNEIYASVQGESTYVGVPCVFVRTTACNLRCRYCDTAYAFEQGARMRVADVVERVTAHGLGAAEVTGGEPLLQPAVLPLMAALCDRGLRVLLETSGSLDFRAVDPRVVKIVDLKSPKSGEEAQNRYDLVPALLPHDEVKLVLWDRGDYEWAKELLTRLDPSSRHTVLLSPVHGRLDPKALVAWVLADKLRVRVQVQLHKYIWDPKARGV